jgi:NAD(P)-dependent dehydrogenase (short-subunit alcohol dehydrogenase family)
MKEKLIRLFRYVFKGIPIVNITKNIVEISDKEKLKDKRIIITGGNRGIGFEMAKKFLDDGAIVHIIGRNEKKLQEANAKLNGKCNIFVFDVSNIQKLSVLIDYFKNYKINVLVNNAGVSKHEKDSFSVTSEGFDEQINTNLKACYFLSVEFAKYLKENKSEGTIINMVSERGLYCDDLPYGLTKAALISFTKGFARRVIKDGIRVNAIAPGVTATEMTGYDENGNLFNEYLCGNRTFLPLEVSELAAFLISDVSNCIAGEVIACDQGNYLRCDW